LGTIAREETLKAVGHGLGGVKETRVIGCEEFFQHELNYQTLQEAQMETRFQGAQYVPRTLIETILVVSVISFVSISLFLSGQRFQDSIAAMGIFAVASIRLVPAASQFVEGLGKIRHSVHTLDILYLDLKDIEIQKFEITTPGVNSYSSSVPSSSLALTYTQELELNNLLYRYPGSSTYSLNKVSFRILKGESIGLIGKSGAGKTTLVDIILGLLIPESGDIRVDGQSIYQNMSAWKQLICYIPQTIFLTDDTIERNIAFGVPSDKIDTERLWHAIKSAQLEDLIEDLPEGVYTPVGERGVRLSGGQRQRIGIARALYHQREILVLDEATSALDNETEKLISDSIKSLAGSKTLIIIAHRLSTLEHCDRIFELEKGRIVRVGSYGDIVLSQNC
jgi:ATP-binding cassette, subfamily B, bacterial PglK